jgi:hypothetical protein
MRGSGMLLLHNSHAPFPLASFFDRSNTKSSTDHGLKILTGLQVLVVWLLPLPPAIDQATSSLGSFGATPGYWLAIRRALQMHSQ